MQIDILIDFSVVRKNYGLAARLVTPNQTDKEHEITAPPRQHDTG